MGVMDCYSISGKDVVMLVNTPGQQKCNMNNYLKSDPEIKVQGGISITIK